MKVYQCIRAYDPYIPAFENKYRINENNYSFSELRNLLIKDGFAATYILKPALDGNEKEFFFTLWNYKTLQFKWAEENGLKTRDLDEIRLAQVEVFKPDVYYNFSPYYDSKVLEKMLMKKEMIKVCWDSVIGSRYPSFHENYNLRFTLFQPYVMFWKQHGFNAFLLPPAFPDNWENLNKTEKDIDLLFYGQYNESFFTKRNRIVHELLAWSKRKNLNFKLYLQFPKVKKPFINIRGFRNYTRWIPVAPKEIMNNALPPIYGSQLYEIIAKSKIVVNAFGNYNGMFKENMRNYESIGCGAFLISEDGIYPEHFIPNIDFYTYRSTSDLFYKIEQVLSRPDKGFKLAQNTRDKLKIIYSKEVQWNNFVNAVNSLG